MKINWTKIKAVFFDVDGTLYDQRKLRRYMLKKLIGYYIMNPQHLQELKLLRDFRREREKRIFEDVEDIENAQYEWGAKASGVNPEEVRNVVQEWIFTVPLKYLPSCRYPGVLELFNNLKRREIVTAIFSDYPAKEKLAVLGILPDYIVCATDKEIDRLKPNPKGLTFLVEKLKLFADQCLFVGDRDDRDGECARKARMPYLILERNNSEKNNQFRTFDELNEHLDNSL